MILKLISYLLVALSFYNSYTLYKRDPDLIRNVYFKNIKDYFWSFLLFISVISTVIFLIQIDMPSILKFSWLNLFGSEGTNLIASGISSNEGFFNIPKVIYKIIPASIFLILCFCLPYLAKTEEQIFRSRYFTIKDRIIQSIKFGFVHMIVGVPVFIALILSVMGYIYSIRYVNSYNKNIKSGIDTYNADENAIEDVTSLHAKYNLITLLVAIIIILII